MNIYTFVRDTCTKANFGVNTGAVQRLVGTLRAAGFQDDLSTKDAQIATQIINKRLKQISSPEMRTAGVESPISSTAKFEEIESLRSKNLCPRCKSTMDEVKLATYNKTKAAYEKAKFCKRCKVALWID